MLSSMFDSSTIPMLEQVVSFTQARHGVLAGNIANLDTPGYKTRDLSPEEFQNRLKEAMESRRQKALSPTYEINARLAGRDTATGLDGMDKVRESIKSVLYHDNSDVSIEQQVAEISKNHALHNLALNLMTAQFRLMRAAITERA
jgi:flagellar basal-body rod protein FlgB